MLIDVLSEYGMHVYTNKCFNNYLKYMSTA